jgi:uncharacterized membrane protein YkoI
LNAPARIGGPASQETGIMLRTKIIPIALAAVIAVGSTLSVAYAANNNRDGDNEGAQELAAVVNAKTSLGQAIAAAEQQSGGKAIDAGLENENGTMTFAVEVAKDNTVQKVLVDLQTGKVLKVLAADSEHGEHGEHEND